MSVSQAEKEKRARTANLRARHVLRLRAAGMTPGEIATYYQCSRGYIYALSRRGRALETENGKRLA